MVRTKLRATMPDGSRPLPPPLEDGVYTDLPMGRYLYDDALSGSAFDKLERNPPDWKWEHPSNPLYEPDEDSKARILGTICHKVLLEGVEAYEAEYCVKPDIKDHPDALDTLPQLKAWLAERDQKVSGTKPELIERVLAHDPRAKVWEAYCDGVINGRTAIGFKLHAQAMLLRTFVESDPVYSKLLSGGLPEVTIVWTEDGVRYKSRIDYLRSTAIVDVKTFGRPPRRTLIRDFLADRVSHGDDKQAVHNFRAAQQLPRLLKEGRATAPTREKLEALERIAAGQKVFVWLGLRVGGAPCGLAVRFDQGTIPWGWAEQKIAHAVAQFKIYREKFGSDVWIRSEGMVMPELSHWPSWGQLEAE